MQPDRILGLGRLDEGEDFRNLIEALKVAETCCRQLAFKRGEKRWILAGANLGQFAAICGALMTGRQRPFEHRFTN